MTTSGVEDWLGIVTLLTMLSGWANYIVIKPLKDMMTDQGDNIKEIKKSVESFKKDVREDMAKLETSMNGNVTDLKDELHLLRERVAVTEHDITTLKEKGND